MIVIRKTSYLFENPDGLKSFKDVDLENIRKEEEENKLDFIIPKRFEKNDEKNIYKSGFLGVFLKELYPDKNFEQISKKINIQYQVFLGKRQIERNVTKFLSEINYRNE